MCLSGSHPCHAEPCLLSAGELHTGSLRASSGAEHHSVDVHSFRHLHVQSKQGPSAKVTVALMIPSMRAETVLQQRV